MPYNAQNRPTWSFNGARKCEGNKRADAFERSEVCKRRTPRIIVARISLDSGFGGIRRLDFGGCYIYELDGFSRLPQYEWISRVYVSLCARRCVKRKYNRLMGFVE